MGTILKVTALIILSLAVFTSPLHAEVERFRAIGDLGSLGGSSTTPFDINDHGHIVGYSYLFTSANFQHGFIWDEVNGMRSLGTLEYANSFALAINNQGQVAGFEMDTFGNGAAFIWDEANGMRRVPGFGGFLTVASDINNLGQVVGHGVDASGAFKAFVWDETNGITPLGTLGGPESLAYGINDRGEVVGSSQLPNGEPHAFVWDAVNGMRDIGLVGEATAINNHGAIVGVGVMPHGNAHAFLLESGTPGGGSSGGGNGDPLEGVMALTGWQESAWDSGADGSFSDYGFSATAFHTDRKKGESVMSITYDNLGNHIGVSLSFLLGVIDKASARDGIEVRVDGVTVFQENIAWDDSAWSPGEPVELFSNMSLGYMDKQNERGYDKGLDMGLVMPADHRLDTDFSFIPHTADTLTLEIIATTSRGSMGYAVSDVVVTPIAEAGSPVVDLGTLGGSFSIPRDINDLGTVVGMAHDASEIGYAFVYRPETGTMVSLGEELDPASGWIPIHTWGLNNLDEMVGIGISGNAFRAYLSRP